MGREVGAMELAQWNMSPLAKSPMWQPPMLAFGEGRGEERPLHFGSAVRGVSLNNLH